MSGMGDVTNVGYYEYPTFIMWDRGCYECYECWRKGM